MQRMTKWILGIGGLTVVLGIWLVSVVLTGVFSYRYAYKKGFDEAVRIASEWVSQNCGNSVSSEAEKQRNGEIKGRNL